MNKKLEAFKRLLIIMDELREQCPWDKKQTIESLRKLTIEETYELTDAITEKNYNGIKEELGDLLMHIVFYSKIGSEKNKFDVSDVLNNVCDKLIRRHPHIYSDVKVNNAEDVKKNWEKIKLTEKKNKTVLGGVPKSLPAIVKANRLQEKARGVGFDWEEKSQVWDKVYEELNEVISETKIKNNKQKIEQEIGDLMFSVINAARLYDIDPENALELTNKKFISRFNYLESKTLKLGKDLHKMPLEKMEEIWQEAKKNEKE